MVDAPAIAKFRAVANPIPFAPPVITIVFPAAELAGFRGSIPGYGARCKVEMKDSLSLMVGTWGTWWLRYRPSLLAHPFRCSTISTEGIW
jgi:hypothetical protein